MREPAYSLARPDWRLAKTTGCKAPRRGCRKLVSSAPRWLIGLPRSSPCAVKSGQRSMQRSRQMRQRTRLRRLSAIGWAGDAMHPLVAGPVKNGVNRQPRSSFGVVCQHGRGQATERTAAEPIHRDRGRHLASGAKNKSLSSESLTSALWPYGESSCIFVFTCFVSTIFFSSTPCPERWRPWIVIRDGRVLKPGMPAGSVRPQGPGAVDDGLSMGVESAEESVHSL